MKITIQPTLPPGTKHRNPTVVVETDNDDHDIHEVFEEVVVPALLAWGFSQEVIDSCLPLT